MNILKIDNKSKEISFICQTIEDLWVIKNITDVGDVIKGSSYRRLKNEETGSSDRKPVFVSIEVEKYDFSSEINSLRFTGKIVFSKPQDLAPLGEYHTLEVSFLNKFTLVKKNLFKHQIDLLKNKSLSENKLNIVLIDDEVCEIYYLTNIEKRHVTTIKSGKHGKRYNKSFDFNSFFENIYLTIKDSKDQIIIAGPGSLKDNLSKYLKEKNITSTTINLSNVSKSGINELFLKKQFINFFKNSLIYKEEKMIEEFKKNLGQNNSLSVYGLNDIYNLVGTGACDFVLVSFNLWKKEFEKIQQLIAMAEKLNTRVSVIDQSHTENLKIVDSFGGIVSVLKYKVY